MPTLRTALTDPDDIAARSLPRDDLLVREHAVGDTMFEAIDGPFRHWTRTLSTVDGLTTETLRYSIAVPHWGRFVDLLLRRPARRGLTAGHQPFWSPADRLSQRDVTVLGLCATLAVVAGFLGGLVGQTISYVTDDLGGGTATQANSLAIIRIGAVLTFAATALADRRGRRPLMKACLVGASLASIVTAFAPNVASVTAAQLVCRGLVAGAAFLIPIVCSEELPARSRAYAIGMMTLPGGLGVGMVLWVLPLMGLGPSSWRLIYLLAAIALVVTLRTVRLLPETRRFVHDDHTPQERLHQHMSGARLALLGVGMFLLNIFTSPTQQLQTDYLRNTRGMGTVALPVFLLLTNTWGLVGVIAGSQIADRRSRRLAAAIGLVGLAIGNSILFQVSGAAMWVASIFGSVVGAVAAPALGALLPELFPTLRRGAANGLLNGAAVLGSVAGLLAAGHFITDGNYGPTIMALAAGPLIVAVLVWWLPETAGVELEELNPDD